jgi:hypothetical protein
MTACDDPITISDNANGVDGAETSWVGASSGVLGSAQTSGVEIAGLGRPTAGRLHLRLRHVLFIFGSFEES